MGIQVKTAESQPAVVFDKVHVTELKVEQPQFEDDTRPPFYSVSISYRMYGVDGENKRHYRGNASEIEIKDFYGVAMDRYQNGDPELAQALGAIERAIAIIISEQTGNGAEVI